MTFLFLLAPFILVGEDGDSASGTLSTGIPVAFQAFVTLLALDEKSPAVEVVLVATYRAVDEARNLGIESDGVGGVGDVILPSGTVRTVQVVCREGIVTHTLYPHDDAVVLTDAQVIAQFLRHHLVA